jgi:hypothetical protein
MNQNVVRQVIDELKEKPPTTTETDNDIIEDELKRAVKRPKSNKSPGNDGVTGEVIKHGRDTLIKELHRICDAIWRDGQAAEEWKKSILIVLHKRGAHWNVIIA